MSPSCAFVHSYLDGYAMGLLSAPLWNRESMPPAAILDVDGTLVDTNYQHALAWYRAFRQHGRCSRSSASTATSAWAGDQFVAALAGEETEREQGDDIRAAEKALYSELIDGGRAPRGRART